MDTDTPTFSVLVADDDADCRRLACFVLRRRGYAVIEAADGDAAVTAIRAARPCLARWTGTWGTGQQAWT